VAATPLAGRMVDRLPRRYAIAIGAVLMAASTAGFVVVRHVGIGLEILRAVQGVSYALVLTGVGTMVAELVPRAHLNQALGLSGASMLVMNALAPAVAEPLAVAAGWEIVFLVATAAALLSAAIAVRIREPVASLVDTDGSGGSLWALLAQPVARDYAVVITLAGATFGAVFTFEPPYALALGRTRVGGFFIAYAVAAIVVRVVFGSVPARLGSYRVARVSLWLYALVVFAMAGVGPAFFEVLGALFGLAHGLFYPAVNAIAVMAVRRYERGRMMAIFTGAFSLGLFAGTTLLGPLAELAGYPTVFVVAGSGTLAAVWVLDRSAAFRAAGHRL
jgi:MFS family permease